MWAPPRQPRLLKTVDSNQANVNENHRINFNWCWAGVFSCVIVCTLVSLTCLSGTMCASRLLCTPLPCAGTCVIETLTFGRLSNMSKMQKDAEEPASAPSQGEGGYAQTAKGYRAIVDVTLVDGSMTETNKNAEIFFTAYIPASQGKQDCEAMNALVQQHIAGEPSASLFDLDQIRQGPREVAWQFVQRAGLNADQIHAVALITWPMQQAWEKHHGAEEPQMQTLAQQVQQQMPLLPLVGMLVRFLLVGGGGCGKSRIINHVVSPLPRCFYGSRGLLLEASSNKAARLIGGVTIHAANSLRGNSSLMTVHLRLSPNKQKIAERRYKCLGGKVFDEFSHNNCKLWHADAYITAVARAPIHDLDPSRYSEPEQTWGGMPVVVVAGDELQMPPVPFEASLLAPVEGSSHEHKVGVKIFSGLRHVYRLRTAMRFKDDLLSGMLAKMRTKGGCRLTKHEWDTLQATEVENPVHDLAGTELWYEASYVWSVVSMAQVIRSRLSAQHHKTVLFIAQAEDQLMNPLCLQAREADVDIEDLEREVGQAILRHTNMNETGRLPSFWMGHMKMKVRLCQTVEPGIAVTDSTGELVGIDFDEREPTRHTEAVERCGQSVVILRYMPKCIHVKLDREDGVSVSNIDLIPPTPCQLHEGHEPDPACADCKFFRDVVAVAPVQNKQAWSIDVRLKGFAELVKVRVKRRQLPTVCLSASTLHVLQGTTCDPGLIFHWKFPKRLRRDLLWLATYVVLSRVRRFKNLRSIGLTTRVREIIEQGPPDTLPAQFEKYFADKEVETLVVAKESIRRLGWSLPSQ